MSQHITRYKTENGKTRKVKGSAGKGADKHGTPGSTGADNKNLQPGSPAK